MTQTIKLLSVFGMTASFPELIKLRKFQVFLFKENFRCRTMDLFLNCFWAELVLPGKTIFVNYIQILNRRSFKEKINQKSMNLELLLPVYIAKRATDNTEI